MKFIIVSIALFWSAVAFAEPKVVVTHALSLFGKPKYERGFRHFDYVNPDAPKGGMLRTSTTGTFDNFHPYTLKGEAARGNDLYDALLTGAEDDWAASYGLIAHTMEYASDYSWIVFHMRPEARFQDGTPITADDVIYTFETYLKKAIPTWRAGVDYIEKMEALDRHRIKFTLREGNIQRIMNLGSVGIIPRQFWKDHDWEQPLKEVPLGSSAYTISDYKMGQYVVWKRLKDYWAKDLPVNRGRMNFDYERVEYYRDTTVEFEAFKAGEYDFKAENVAKRWANQYVGEHFDKGFIRTESLKHSIPQRMQAFIFNVRNDLFRDVRVREALNYAMDFEWMNKNLFYGQYVRTRSYFSNTEYEAKGLPEKGELELLEPIRQYIPPRVFTEEFQPAKTDGSGSIRSNIRKALRLFKEAGWELKERRLTHAKTGRRFEFAMLRFDPNSEYVALPLQKNLKKMGIEMRIRTVDNSQFFNRLRDHDYDLVSYGFSANYYPNVNLKSAWHSGDPDNAFQFTGIGDRGIDALIEMIDSAQNHPERLGKLGAALDRVLQWNFFVIPHWHIDKFRIAYWDKFSRPKVRPKYGLGLSTWWYDAEKAKRLPKKVRATAP